MLFSKPSKHHGTRRRVVSRCCDWDSLEILSTPSIESGHKGRSQRKHITHLAIVSMNHLAILQKQHDAHSQETFCSQAGSKTYRSFRRVHTRQTWTNTKIKAQKGIFIFFAHLAFWMVSEVINDMMKQLDGHVKIKSVLDFGFFNQIMVLKMFVVHLIFSNDFFYFLCFTIFDVLIEDAWDNWDVCAIHF